MYIAFNLLRCLESSFVLCSKSNFSHLIRFIYCIQALVMFGVMICVQYVQNPFINVLIWFMYMLYQFIQVLRCLTHENLFLNESIQNSLILINLHLIGIIDCMILINIRLKFIDLNQRLSDTYQSSWQPWFHILHYWINSIL